VTTSQTLLNIYHLLLERYRPQHWWPGDGPFEVIIGAILTQSAAWANVDRALANLKQAEVLSPGALRDLPGDTLADLLRPSGYFNAKARKVKAFVEHLGSRHQDDLDALLRQPAEMLRQELLSIHGIGEETADDILLYAAGYPFFVVDAYTRRIFERLGITPQGATYQAWQTLFHQVLPREATLFNEYHALLVAHGKATCRKSPLCKGCCLLDLCPTGQARAGAARGV
jgi:endonuclease-3 related protein